MEDKKKKYYKAVEELCDLWFGEEIKGRGNMCIFCYSHKGHTVACPHTVYMNIKENDNGKLK